MKPGVKSKAYLKRVKAWERNRIFCRGPDAIRAANMRFLPPGPNMNEREYLIYLASAFVPDAASSALKMYLGRTVGETFGVEGENASLKNWLKAVTPSRDSFVEFSRAVFSEAFCVGCCGIYVTMGPTGRPFFAKYNAESIHGIMLREDAEGFQELAGVLLYEVGTRVEGGKTVESENYRELVMEDDGFHVYLHKQQQGGKYDRQEVEFKVRDERLKEIPFYFANADGQKWGWSETAPMSSVVEPMRHYWRTAASHRVALHIAGQPMPCFAGFKQPDANAEPTNYDKKALQSYLDDCNLKGLFSDKSGGRKANELGFTIGSTSALWGPEGAKAFYMAMDPAALTHLKEERGDLREEMVTAGAKNLMRSGSVPKTAFQVSAEEGSSDSIIASTVKNSVRALDGSLRMAVFMLNIQDLEAKTRVSYEPVNMRPDTAVAATLKTLLENGAISPRTAYEFSQKIGIGGPRTWDEEATELAAATPDIGITLNRGGEDADAG